MLLKIILVLVVIYVVYKFFIKKKPLEKKSDKNEKQPNDLVECAKCGVYCELNEAILSNGKYYCSNECLKD